MKTITMKTETLDRLAVSNGITAFLFAITGPLALLITIGREGGLPESVMASWIFGSYGVGGALSLYFCLRYRQPLGMAWTIPGILLLPAALDHLGFAEIVGAYWISALLITVLGWSGWVNSIMRRIPMPIVMGMVAGVFLPLGIKVVTSFTQQATISAVALGAYVIFSIVPAMGRLFPPVLAALVAGGFAAWGADAIAPLSIGANYFAQPILYMPEFSIGAMVELVIPMTITVLAIQNAQGFAVLQQAGHAAPVKAVTVGVGLGSMIMALCGSVPACLTGPVNAILVSSGERDRHWLAGLVFALAMIVFGLLAPLATSIALALPVGLIALVGGLAMVRALQGAFQSAFRDECPLGALVSFVVSVAGVPILNIGAPFWGLVFAFVASWLFERESLYRAIKR